MSTIYCAPMHSNKRMQADASKAGAADAGRYKAFMRILVILLLSINVAPSLAVQEIPVGKVYKGDLRAIVEKYTYEMITDEISIDINLDGKKEIAIGVTCGNAGCDYHIFSNTNGGGYEYLGNLFFHPEAITIDPQTHIIKAYIRLNAAEGCDNYFVQGNQGFSKVKKECNY